MLAKLFDWSQKRRKLIRQFGLVSIATITNRLNCKRGIETATFFKKTKPPIS